MQNVKPLKMCISFFIKYTIDHTGAHICAEVTETDNTWDALLGPFAYQ